MTVDRTLMPGGGTHRDAFLRNPPTHVEALDLAPNAAESVTVPFGATTVLFSGSGDFFARPNGTAAVPAADVVDGSAAELNPTLWQLDGVSSLSLVSSAATTVTMTYYLGPGATSGTLYPLTLPALVDWFDSQDETTVLGANPPSEVESWVGRTGTLVLSNHLGTGPAYQERLGRPVLNFDNGPRLDTDLSGSLPAAWTNSSFEIWAVVEMTAGDGRFLYQLKNAADADIDISLHYAVSTGGSSAEWRDEANVFRRRDPVSTGPFPMQPVIFRQWRTGQDMLDVEALPGRVTPAIGATAGSLAVDQLTIGTNAAGASSMIGYYSSLLIFDGELSDDEAATLIAFLRARYGAA